MCPFGFASYLKEGNDDGSHHDERRVEDGPEDEGDGQSARFCKLLNV